LRRSTSATCSVPWSSITTRWGYPSSSEPAITGRNSMPVVVPCRSASGIRTRPGTGNRGRHQVALQILLELRDRLPVHSWCTLVRLDFFPRLPDCPLRNLERLAWCFQLAHTTPPGTRPVDRTNTAADNPAPSLQPHYRAFTTTTNRSASAPLPVVRLLLFPVNAADRARVVYMPDTAWPISGLPPDSSRDLFHTPVLMSPAQVSTRRQRFACARLPDPHLTPDTAPFPNRSPRRSSTNLDHSPGGLAASGASRGDLRLLF
jgi:hypothetical protein